MTLKSRFVGGHSSDEFMHDLYVVKSTDAQLSVCRLSVGLCSFAAGHTANPIKAKVVRCGHSGSINAMELLVPIESQYATFC